MHDNLFRKWLLTLSLYLYTFFFFFTYLWISWHTDTGRCKSVCSQLITTRKVDDSVRNILLSFFFSKVFQSNKINYFRKRESRAVLNTQKNFIIYLDYGIILYKLTLNPGMRKDNPIIADGQLATVWYLAARREL